MSEAGVPANPPEPAKPSADPAEPVKPQRKRRGRATPWPRLFARSDEALFVLDRHLRIRYVNRACERLIGQRRRAVYRLRCVRRRSAAGFQRVLAPPAEALSGTTVTVRRTPPNRRNGPPWWDITFLPMLADGRLLAIVGKIAAVAADHPQPRTHSPLNASTVQLRAAHVQSFSLADLESEYPAMLRVQEQARLASRSQVAMSVVGPPGSGKQHLARIIHAQSPQRELLWVSFDCAGLPARTLSEQLLGPSPALAANQIGTLYLRQPQRLPLAVQEELAALLADPSRCPPRVIAGLTEPLDELQRAGTLHATLASRLGVLVVQLPSLHERRADLARLAAAMLLRISQLRGRPLTLAVETLTLLQAHPWPGNLRQLYDTLRQAAANTQSGVIVPESLPYLVRACAETPPVVRSTRPTLGLEALLAKVELRLIEAALARHRGNKAAVAEELGINRSHLYKRLRSLGLSEQIRPSDEP